MDNALEVLILFNGQTKVYTILQGSRPSLTHYALKKAVAVEHGLSREIISKLQILRLGAALSANYEVQDGYCYEVKLPTTPG